MAIPAAEGSELSVFEHVFADIGDEQSIEQSLSTFSSHMTHIVEILDPADDRCLVLLDELGAGTDPEEGAALAQALLNTLLGRSITALATTHYSELKVFAHNTPFVTNASVEFDIETLSPTYQLSIGLPGRSNAFAIARRLGLPSPIVTQAEALVSPQSVEAETMLAEIKRAREAALAAEAEAKATARRAEALQADLQYRLAGVEDARREVLAEAVPRPRPSWRRSARRSPAPGTGWPDWPTWMPALWGRAGTKSGWPKPRRCWPSALKMCGRCPPDRSCNPSWSMVRCCPATECGCHRCKPAAKLLWQGPTRWRSRSAASA